MSADIDLVIVGGGLTGLWAAHLALARGMRVSLVAQSAGSLPYMSGALDLLGVYPTETKRFRQDPWEALEALLEAEPDHPYSRVGQAGVSEAWETFSAFLAESPLRYQSAEHNRLIVTCAGTLKPTLLLPSSMEANTSAWEQRAETVLLGFDHFADFSPEQPAQVLKARWPGLRAARLDLVDLLRCRPSSMALAAAFDKAEFREAFVDRARPLIGAATFVGLPAVLGESRSAQVCDELSERLGARVFEIPLLSPSIPGVRLDGMLRRSLQDAGLVAHKGRPVIRVNAEGARVTGVVRGGVYKEEEIRAKHVLLATGRFFGGGLEATLELNGGAGPRTRLREPLLDLPVDAPTERNAWHMETFLGAPGHPVNRCGLKVDAAFRPVDASGEPLYANLRAAGAILAEADWVREKSGAGISIVTAHGAVEAIAREAEGERR